MKEKDKLTVELTKLDPKKFDGNISEWTEFWDTFKQQFTITKVYTPWTNSTI